MRLRGMVKRYNDGWEGGYMMCLCAYVCVCVQRRDGFCGGGRIEMCGVRVKTPLALIWNSCTKETTPVTRGTRRRVELRPHVFIWSFFNLFVSLSLTLVSLSVCLSIFRSLQHGLLRLSLFFFYGPSATTTSLRSHVKRKQSSYPRGALYNIMCTIGIMLRYYYLTADGLKGSQIDKKADYALYTLYANVRQPYWNPTDVIHNTAALRKVNRSRQVSNTILVWWKTSENKIYSYVIGSTVYI